MHAVTAGFVAECIERHDHDHGPFQHVYEIGGRNVNGGVRSLFGPCNYHSVDLQMGPDVDEVADARGLTDPAEWDCVVCCNVFEHLEDWRTLVYVAHLKLRDGGWFIVTVPADPFPAHSGIDGCTPREDEWYRNISGPELAAALWDVGFRVLTTHCPPGNAMAVGIK